MDNMMTKSEQFHPFDKNKRMNWNILIPGTSNFSHMDMENSWCLMLNTKTGVVFMKRASEVSLMEWNQAASSAAVIAVANESECF